MCGWPIPRRACARFRARNSSRSWSGYAALFDYTIAFANAPESKPGFAWLLPFLVKFKTIFLQVLLLAVAITFLQLLFPVFTQMVVDKVIVENNVSLLETILLGMGAAVFFVQVSSLAQEYLLTFAAVRLDTAILDFLTRQMLSLPMTYFTSRRTGDIQRRLDGARQVRQFAVQHGIGAHPRARPAGRRAFAHGGLQPVAHVRLSRHDAALRRADVFLGKGPAPALRRRRREPGQIQLAPDRCDQGH